MQSVIHTYKQMTCRPSNRALGPSAARAAPGPAPRAPLPPRRSAGRRTAVSVSAFRDSGAGADYYATLGVAKDADKKAIKSAYRNLARKYHPVGPGRCMGSRPGGVGVLGWAEPRSLRGYWGAQTNYAWEGRPRAVRRSLRGAAALRQQKVRLQ